MTARTPLNQIEAAMVQIVRAGYDHDDHGRACAIINALRTACEIAERMAERCEDRDLAAALLHPQWGVPAYLADAAGDLAQFFTTWDDRRADRAQEARDNKAADAADARIAL